MARWMIFSAIFVPATFCEFLNDHQKQCSQSFVGVVSCSTLAIDLLHDIFPETCSLHPQKRGQDNKRNGRNWPARIWSALDDTEQLKLIRFYRERPMFWDISIKLPTSAKEQRAKRRFTERARRALCPPVHIKWVRLCWGRWKDWTSQESSIYVTVEIF